MFKREQNVAPVGGTPWRSPDRLVYGSASGLRHQLGVPDLDRTAFKILRDIRVILRHPLKGLLRCAIARDAGETANALSLLSIVGSVVHITSTRSGGLQHRQLLCFPLPRYLRSLPQALAPGRRIQGPTIPRPVRSA